MRSVALAIPQVPINMRALRPENPNREFPKMMSYRDKKTGKIKAYKADDGVTAVIVNDPDEEAAFREENPEALKSFSVNPTAVRNEELEDENAKLRALLRSQGVNLDDEPAKGRKVKTEDDGNDDDGDLKQGNSLDSMLPTAMSTAPAEPKADIPQIAKDKAAARVVSNHKKK